MDIEAVERWMDAYRAAWISNVRSEVAELFTEDGVYSVSPIAEPWIGREENLRRWVAGIQQDVEMSYEVLSSPTTRPSSTGTSSPRTWGIPSGSSTTASWLFASRRTGAALSIASGTSDARSRGEPCALSRRDLEHGTGLRSWEEKTVGREANDLDDAVIAIKEHGVDGESHTERMNGPTAAKQQPFIRSERVAPAEAAGPFTHRLGDLNGEGAESLAPHAARNPPI